MSKYKPQDIVMNDKDVLIKIKRLSNGKFGKDIVIAGDAQIVLQKLMEIHVLVSNHLNQPNKVKE